MHRKLKKAKLLLYLQAVLQFQGFIGPIIFIFYTQYMGLSTSEYLVCDSVLFVVMAICEVPSGIIADYIGRKKALIISQVAVGIGMLLLLTVPSFAGAVLVALIFGFFGALESGVSESILYETYEKGNSIEQYEYIQAKAGGVAFIVSIVYAIASGYLVEYKLVLPVILDLVVCIIALLASLMLLEDSKNYDKAEKISLPTKNEINNTIYVVLVVAILLSCSRVMFSFYQPILTEIKLPTVFLGYASAIYSLIAAGSAFLYKKIRGFMSTKGMYALIISLQIIATLGIAFVNNYFVIGFIFVQQVQRGIIGSFLYMQVNRYIDTKSGNRVSLMSIMYCGISVLTGVSLYITSAITNNYGLGLAVVYYAIVINILLMIATTIFLKKENEKKLVKYDAEE